MLRISCQVRQSDLYVLNGASCDCSGVERSTATTDDVTDDDVTSSSSRRRRRRRGHLLVIGRRLDDRYVIAHALPSDWRRRRRAGSAADADQVRRAVRTIRRRGETVCTRSRPPV